MKPVKWLHVLLWAFLTGLRKVGLVKDKGDVIQVNQSGARATFESKWDKQVCFLN